MSDTDTKPTDSDESVDAADGATAAGTAAEEEATQATAGAAQRAGEVAQRAGEAAQRAGGVLTDVAGDVASSVSAHAPAVIDASRSGAAFAAREVQGASSENLLLGTVFSTGLSLGLLLSRAPRLLVAVALTPVFVFGGTLVSRRVSGTVEKGSSGRGATASRPSRSGTSGS